MHEVKCFHILEPTFQFELSPSAQLTLVLLLLLQHPCSKQ